MIESIEIKNFRCFKDTKIAKFGLVNLFGGLNNSGKTALLEAVYLAESLSDISVIFLHRFVRREEASAPQDVWSYLFFQKDISQEIILNIVNTDLKNSKVIFNYDEKIDNFASLPNTNFSNTGMPLQFHPALLSNPVISSLYFKKYENDEEKYSSSLVASISGINNSTSILQKITAHFIPASFKLFPVELAIEYDKAKFDGKDSIILKILQLVDSNIEMIEFFALGKPTLYLQRKGEARMPITLFGDAINKIVEIILRIVNNPSAVILIDEIENGIHYTNQKKLWEMLFKLAIEYNVQIFSTSHSLEMIKAFAKVAQQFPEKAAYFEMARSPKTGLIKGILHDVNTLAFELDRNMTIRGE